MKALIIIMVAAFAFSAIADWLGVWEFVGGFLLGVAVSVYIKVRKYEKQ